MGTVELGAPGVHHGVLIRQVQSQALPVSGQKWGNRGNRDGGGDLLEV